LGQALKVRRRFTPTLIGKVDNDAAVVHNFAGSSRSTLHGIDKRKKTGVFHETDS
jgi:hypothetical protein